MLLPHELTEDKHAYLFYHSSVPLSLLQTIASESHSLSLVTTLEVQSPFPEIGQYKKEESKEKQQEEEEDNVIDVSNAEIRRRQEEKRICSSIPRGCPWSFHSTYHLSPEPPPKHRCIYSIHI
jgi:hypothetical protein